MYRSLLRLGCLALLGCVACGLQAAGSANGGVSSGWAAVPISTTADLGAVWASSPEDVWIASGNTAQIFHGGLTGWTATPTPGCPRGEMPGASTIWGDSTGGVWTAGCSMGQGAGGILRWDGHQWNPLSLNDSRSIAAIGGSGPDDVWAFGTLTGYLGHWNGTMWTHIDSEHNANAVWSHDGSAAWAVGGDPSDMAGGHIDHFDGHSWTPQMAQVPHALLGLSGTGVDDVWAVGMGATILHFDGLRWTPFSAPTTGAMHSVWAATRNDAWAVGDNGVILHFTGAGWGTVPSPTRNTLRSVWGTPAGDVWAVGDKGTVLQLPH